MARKNSQKTDTTGAIVFDSRTKSVMTQVGQDNVKQKVQAVKEIVPGKNANEIILVLQYYDNCVERTIQAYMEDGAKEALKEWHLPDNKVLKQKKKNKKKSNQNPPSTDQQQKPNSQGPVSISKVANDVVNGDMPKRNKSTVRIGKNASRTGVVISSSSSSSSLCRGELHTAAGKEVELTTTSQRDLNGDSSKSDLHTNNESEIHKQRSRPKSGQAVANSQTHQGSKKASVITSANSLPKTGHSGSTKSDNRVDLGPNVVAKVKKPYAGLEKSIKDLNRQTVSLDRLQLVLNEEVKKAYKRISTVFEEMYSCLKERESQMIQELDKVNLDAEDIIKQRKQKAADLKVQIDRAQQMNDSEVAELRSQIKEFVSFRRIDEDIGRSTRFHYDSDHLKNEINKFGEITPVNKCAYSVNRPNQNESSSSNGSSLQPPPIPSAVINTSHNLPEEMNGNNSSNSNSTSQDATTEEPVAVSSCPVSSNTNNEQYQHSRTFSSNYKSSDYRNNYSSGRSSRNYHQVSNRGHRRGDGGYRGNSDSYYPNEQRVQYLGRAVHFGARRSRPGGVSRLKTNSRDQDNSVYR
ncbi:spermatogenesis-associated serine-rich protein 2 isoform X2 [Octopus bimaculoides]|uniref:spermatogenesis-associated serine-rich protein 2 isoform X2 n=1 Tax=Octopus bimaculoides TaxID=37653 RepID=UPI00071CF60E|nr:spermatogenesis-associated serine-rich protein 2 isoform X2 [Octopus bimaculoides]|eukprot:XP_014788053.1 PREDICTED: spermatogenesis-associated serine-rich protein 2-like isoform X1 [Octopus bimaculoides]